MTDRPRITIDAPDGPTVLAARHLDATEGRTQVGTTVDTSTRAAITRILDYVAKAHNSPPASEDGEEQAAPVDWQTIAQDRERELKTACEARHRAEAALTRVRNLANRLNTQQYGVNPDADSLRATIARDILTTTDTSKTSPSTTTSQDALAEPVPEPAATQATEKAICPHGCNVTHCPCPACEAERPDEQDDTDQTEPDTITDPEWLKQQYAAAVQPLLMDTLPKPIAAARAWDIADTIGHVRDRHLQQLRQRLALADQARREDLAAEPLDRHPAIAAWGNAYDRANQAEQQRDQLAADLRYALDDHGPRHAHQQPAVWDDTSQPCAHCTRLQQARQHLAALNPQKEPTP